MIVLDASAGVDFLMRTPVGLRVEGYLQDGEESIHIPELFDLEVVQTLRRLLAKRVISRQEAERGREDLWDLRAERYPHRPILGRIWELRNSLSAYDAAYVALAESLDVPLITTDGRLGRSHGHEADIRVAS